MNCRQEHVEHPTLPKCSVIVSLLIGIVMPDTKVIGNIEKLSFVFLQEVLLHLRSNVLKHVDKIANCLTAVIKSRPMAAKFDDRSLNAQLNLVVS